MKLQKANNQEHLCGGKKNGISVIKTITQGTEKRQNDQNATYNKITNINKLGKYDRRKEIKREKQ